MLSQHPINLYLDVVVNRPTEYYKFMRDVATIMQEK